MAELTSSCCSTEAQASCCEPEDKGACCDSAAHAEGSCGCSAGQTPEPDIRETVREKYAAAARAAASATTLPSSCCGPTEVALTDKSGTQVFGDALYDERQTEGATATAVAASL